MLKGLPLVYFHAMKKGSYDASWPVYIVGDNPVDNTFTVAVDEKSELTKDYRDAAASESALIRRKYLTRLTRVRLHQSAFRIQVLDAYREQCAICRLKHITLLEAAHIIPDADTEGEPIVSNGLSLCKNSSCCLRPEYSRDIPRLRNGNTDGCFGRDRWPYA